MDFKNKIITYYSVDIPFEFSKDKYSLSKKEQDFLFSIGGDIEIFEGCAASSPFIRLTSTSRKRIERVVDIIVEFFTDNNFIYIK